METQIYFGKWLGILSKPHPINSREFFVKRPRLDKSDNKSETLTTIQKSEPSEITEFVQVKETVANNSIVRSTSVLFSELCNVFEQIEATTKRLIIAEILKKFFTSVMQHHKSTELYYNRSYMFISAWARI